MAEIGRRFYSMIEPLEEVSKWEETLVKGQHDLWVGISR